MRRLLLFFFCCYLHTVAAQNSNSTPLTGNGTTYAVVVGISSYESPGIPQLSFAHRDAQEFAGYLQSKAGGAVPADNIRLLVNENATFAAIYDALDWLRSVCHANDLVYFYFSGHGDVENATIYKLGFLLSYNTPRTNYLNNAVRIEDLNNFANTLSVSVHARVVLITDACHSGKLAGDENRGTFLVGNQLRAVQDKEIRITSCAAGEVSSEDAGWGGGRGVFSYYLVNGLAGSADRDRDRIITVGEIRNYLDSALAADALLAEKLMKQDPVIEGNDRFLLAKVMEQAKINGLSNAPVVQPAMPGGFGLSIPKPLAAQPADQFFSYFNKSEPENTFDFAALNTLQPAAVPAALLQQVRKKQQDSSETNGLPQPKMDSAALASLDMSLRSNPDALQQFTTRLVVALDNRGQKMINLYLSGDAAELERRRYYNARSNGYDVYPLMYALALKLTPASSYQHHLLEVKQHYFAGVAARLKMPASSNPVPLLDTALAEQQRAMNLEPNAAYIQNELGVLALAKNKPAEAEKYFLRAAAITPQWALPQANLAAVYNNTGAFDKAMAAADRAELLQPEFQGIYLNRGASYEQTGKLQQAEEMYRKSIVLNTRHYLPFERLGDIYLKETQYRLADSFFFESDKRKKGFHFEEDHGQFLKIPPALAVMPGAFCQFDSTDVGPRDVMGNLVWGLLAAERHNDVRAEKQYKLVIALDKNNPLAFHHLGKLLRLQQRYEEAALVFNQAIHNYMPKESFDRYADSLSLLLRPSNSKTCIISKFSEGHYYQTDDHYLYGDVNESWQHYGEAEEQYRAIIQLAPDESGGYFLLWRLQEKAGRYRDAEETIQQYANKDSKSAEREFHAFYKRMMERMPGEAEWFYRGGIQLYRLYAADAENYPYDKKKMLPDSDKEVYLTARADFSEPDILYPQNNFEVFPGLLNPINRAPVIVYPLTYGIAFLKKADSLMQRDETAMADINGKIGDLYNWQGLVQRSIPFYRKAVLLQPEDANNRLKLIAACDTTYLFTEAMAQLDSLNRRREISFAARLLLAKYSIHQGNYSIASRLLDTARRLQWQTIPAIVELNARMAMMSHQPKNALPLYQQYLQLKPRDREVQYSIARLYAQTGEAAAAWKWLETAMQAGFRYGFVLREDPVWDKFRGQQKWTALAKQYPVFVYY